MSDARQTKRDQFTDPEKKGGASKIVGVLLVLVVAATVGGFMLLGQGASDGYAKVKGDDGLVRIDLAEVSDGQAHYFKFASSRGEVKFFVVKSVDGEMRAAFDACDVCYRAKKGYRQEGNMMVCNNCDMKFRTDRINDVKGGCNPAPLNRRIEGQQLVISERDIVNGAWYFGG